MPSVQLNGTEIWYLDEGSGAPLIFLHGIGGNYRMFSPQIGHFLQTYRVIALDLRGNGNSGKLTGPLYSILDQQCKDIESLMEFLDVKQAVFCGTSYGGMLGLYFAIHYPERVTGLVVSDGFSDSSPKQITDGIIYSINLLTFWMNYLPRSWMVPLLSLRYRRWPLAKRYAIEVARHVRKHELVLQRLLLLKINFTKDLPRIQCTVLGIVGDDFSVSIRRMQRAMKAIPKARLEIVKNSFDPTNLCQVDLYNQLVKEYLVKIKWR